jgi:hypothetical protein
MLIVGAMFLAARAARGYAALAKLILADPTYAGKTVVICLTKWKGRLFDQVYVIPYHEGAAALATSRHDNRHR